MPISSTSSRPAIAKCNAPSPAASICRLRSAPRSPKSASAAAALELIENAYAELAPFSWDRIVERHGHLAAIRESMLVLEDLPAATRVALVAKLSDTLAQFVVARNWLSADRAGRIASEARERSTVNIAARSRGDDMRGLVQHLRATGQLTAGLILRALLSGNLELFDAALAELSEPAAGARLRAAARPRRRQPAGAADAAPACRNRPSRRSGWRSKSATKPDLSTRIGGAARLRRRMVERVLTHCETDPQGRRAAVDPAAALRHRVGAGRSPHVLRRTGRRRGDRAAPARADRGVRLILQQSGVVPADAGHPYARASKNVAQHDHLSKRAMRAPQMTAVGRSVTGTA